MCFDNLLKITEVKFIFVKSKFEIQCCLFKSPIFHCPSDNSSLE